MVSYVIRSIVFMACLYAGSAFASYPNPIAPPATPSFYKGFWTVDDRPGSTSMYHDTARMVSNGINVVVVNKAYCAKGASFGYGIQNMGYTMPNLQQTIRNFHNAGIATVVAFDLLADNNNDGDCDDSVDNADGVSWASDATFQSNLRTKIYALANVINTEQSVGFLPLNEADVKMMSASLASTFMQSIISTVQSTFTTGVVIWNAGLGTNISSIDFTGFDMVGTSISPWGIESLPTFLTRMGSYCTIMNTAVSTYGLAGSFFSSFGIWGSASGHWSSTPADSLAVLDGGFDYLYTTCGHNAVFAWEGHAGFPDEVSLSDLGSIEALLSDYYNNIYP